MQPSQQRPTYPDEVTLREFMLGLVDLLRWLKRHWWQLALFMFIGAASVTFYKTSRDPEYKATLTFILADDQGGQMGGLGSVLGQFGLPTSSGKYNIDKLLEIAKSRRIVEQVLLSQISVKGQLDYIGNHLIDLYQLNSKWSQSFAKMQDFRFQRDDILNFSDTENYALKNLHKLIVGTPGNRQNGLLQMSYGNTDYVMSFEMTSLDPEVSLATTRLMFDQLKEFYIYQATSHYRTTYELILNKRDSIAGAYQELEYNIARLKDRSAGTFLNSNQIKISNLSSKSLGLKLALGEIEKSLSVAEMALKSSTPIIQKIDDPIGPLAPLPLSLLRNIIIGSLLGALVYMLALFAFTTIKLV